MIKIDGHYGYVMSQHLSWWQAFSGSKTVVDFIFSWPKHCIVQKNISKASFSLREYPLLMSESRGRKGFREIRTLVINGQ